MSEARPVHLDTDPGLDDLLAIALALGSPGLRVESLTTVAGNAGLGAVTENAQRVLALARARLPIGRGAARPIALEPCDATQFHGPDGRRGVSIPALDRHPVAGADEVLRHSLDAGGVRCIVALGPLTNLALLAQDHPELLRHVEIVWMGGSLERGNATPLAEFNAWADPAAVAVILDCEARLRVIPLEVTESVVLRPCDLGDAPFGDTLRGRTLEALLDALMEAERASAGERRASLHDPCAVLAAGGEDLFRYQEKALQITVDETRERGRLRERDAGVGPTSMYAVEANVAEIKRLFLERLRDWAGSAE